LATEQGQGVKVTPQAARHLDGAETACARVADAAGLRRQGVTVKGGQGTLQRRAHGRHRRESEKRFRPAGSGPAACTGFKTTPGAEQVGIAGT
jgi:hypothetical protein